MRAPVTSAPNKATWPGRRTKCAVAIRLAPENPLYLSALGGIAARQWEAGQSVARPGKTLRSSRTRSLGTQRRASCSKRYRWILEQSSRKQRRFKAGLTLAQDTARRFPASARAQQMLGLFLTRNQQNPAAVAAYRKALSLSPESSDLSVGLGIAQTMAGLLPQAVKTLEAGIRKWPGDAVHYQAFGVLLLRMAEEGSDTEAQGVQMLVKALELNPALSEAHYQLGNLALKHGDSSRGNRAPA